MLRTHLSYHFHAPVAACFLLWCAPVSHAELLAEWDFSDGRSHGWAGNPRVESIEAGGGGLVVRCVGEDPWLEGPRFDAPGDGMLRVTLSMRSDEPGNAQWFYGPAFSAERQLRFRTLGGGGWQDYSLVIPESTGPGTRLRLDPFDTSGTLTLRSIRVEAIPPLAEPPFLAPGEWEASWDGAAVANGGVVIRHSGARWNQVELSIDGVEMARGYDGELLGIAHADGAVEFLELGRGTTGVRPLDGGGIRCDVRLQDSRGAEWAVGRTFAPVAGVAGAIEVVTTVTADENRGAVLLPWLTLLPGHGSFGAAKHQGLLAGVEYLADEPSSSEKDLRGPRARRRVPRPVDTTFPLMAVEHDGRYAGVVWDGEDVRRGLVAPGFDSPDRVFGSGGHAMWLSGPGVGEKRFPNDLVGHSPIGLRAGEPVTVRATIVGGESPSVVGAVQSYLALRPPPPLPEVEGGYAGAVELMARGWLDSAANVGWRFRHAVWGDRFGPQVAAGPAMWMGWLAGQARDGVLAGRLRDGVEKTLAEISPADPYQSDISHVRLPSAPLVFGRVQEFIAGRKRAAFHQLGRFDEGGKITYRPGETDYGSTHFADHANGLGGAVLAQVLEAAVLCNDPELTGRVLAVLDKQEALYANTVPRGAQTWEVPLHTPDILASAHLTRAYCYGYLLSGDSRRLEQAKYWAWTGVPFVYLENPADGDIGLYATAGVLGATNWVAPVWIGLPVQWCGLVYASALHHLAKFDPDGPWRQIAQGITRSGVQMTWPASDAERQGLLPDFFHFDAQVSDGPAINPGTVGAHLPEAFDAGRIYDYQKSEAGWIAHAPCEISGFQETGGRAQFELGGWGIAPFHLAVAGIGAGAKVTAGGSPVAAEFHAGDRLLVVPLEGATTVTIELAR